MCEFIDSHHDEHGVEPICRELRIAPSTYYARRGKLKNRPINDRADHFMHWTSPCGLAAADMIVGDVVLVGPVDGEGNDTSVPQPAAAHFGVTIPA